MQAAQVLALLVPEVAWSWPQQNTSYKDRRKGPFPFLALYIGSILESLNFLGPVVEEESFNRAFMVGA